MIWAAIHKDVLLLVRDRGALLSLFALPVAFMLVFGAIFQVDTAKQRAIPIWYAAGDHHGVAIARVLNLAPSFRATEETTPEAVHAKVSAKHADAGIVVLPDSIEIVVARDLPLQTRGPLVGALEGLVVRALVPPDLELPPITVTSSPEHAHRATHPSSFQISVPGNAVLFGFFLALTVAMSFAHERRTGTWQRLLAAPVPRWHALAAMLVPYFVVGAAQLAFFFSLGAWVFGMEVAGSPLALVLLSVALVYCAVALGLLFAAFGGSERQLGGFGSVALLVMGMIGGCMVPRSLMPELMQRLGLAVPHGWALDGYSQVLAHADTSVIDVTPSLAALLLFGSAFAAVGIALFRFERV